MPPTEPRRPKESTAPAVSPTEPASDQPPTVSSPSTVIGRAPLFAGIPTSSSPPPLPSDPDEPASASGSPSDEAAPADGPTARPTSPVALADRRHLKRIIRKALEAATGAAHNYLADEEAQARGLYVAQELELEDGSEHLSAIAARHGVAASNDTADAIQAGVILAAYLVRQFQIRAQLRRDRNARAMFAPPATEQETAA